MEAATEVIPIDVEKAEEPSYNARCFSCKTDVPVRNAQLEVTKNQRTRVHGLCGNSNGCEKKVSKFVKGKKE